MHKKVTGRRTIGVLSALSGVNIETIRYYERIGIMPKAPRNAGNQRVYEDGHVKRLAFVRRCRELGFSLEEVRGLLRFVDSGDYTCADVRTLAEKHLAVLHQKITDLRKMTTVLEGMAAQCDGGEVPECPIIEVLSSA